MNANSLKCLAGAALFGLAAAPALAAAPLKFGVVSDVHVQHPCDTQTWATALGYYRAQGVDGVIVAGDISNISRVDQFEWFVNTWKAFFPGNRAPDGRAVEPLFIYGNHDMWGCPDDQKGSPEGRAQYINVDDNVAKTWERTMGEKYTPIWMKTVKGHKFIGAHWYGAAELPKFLEEHAAELTGPRPFFVILHAHPQDTCLGHWAWGHDDGKSTAALAKFPNAVVFSGHSHYPLTDERSLWQGAFTSLNTASLSYSSHDYNFYENLKGNSYGYTGDKRPKSMSTIKTDDGRWGMLVTVEDGRVTIVRRNFADGSQIPELWAFTVPPAAGSTFAERKAVRSAPEFAPGAAVQVEVGEKTIDVHFPAARTVNGCRVFSYELTATLVEDDIDLIQAQRRMVAADYHLAETPAGRPGHFVFRQEELPLKGHYVFSVRPLECFGNKGAAISSEVVEIK